MERALNPRLEKETIYEIYRACRLCGAGAGYKMPIMQNVIDLEDSEINLSKKIRECVQIEVHADDKMPPLICELCVDKVNDFYEFLELCRQTNKRTRLKLGLPMQATPKGAPDSGDCILGDTAPIYITEDSDGEPLSKHKSKTKAKDKEREHAREKDRGKSKVKKEPEVKIKVEVPSNDRSRTCRRPPASAAPPPVRITRTSCAGIELNGGLEEPQKKSKPAPKIIIKKEKEDIKVEDDSPRLKRLRDNVKTEVPAKKVKILMEQCPSKSNKQASPRSKSKPPAKRPASPIAKQPAYPAKHPAAPAKHPAAPAKHHAAPAKHPAAPARNPARHPAGPARREKSPARRPASPASVPTVQHTCKICFQVHKSSQGYHNHLRSHTVTFTRPTLACNACGEWYPTYDEACSHHRTHRQNSVPYKCRRCSGEFKTHHTYEEHFGQSQCIPYDEMPDVKCDECWRYFATDRLLIEHKCAGEEGRPGGKCVKCNRTYVLLKNLRRHETTCMHRRQSEVIADPEVMTSSKLVQIRVARCDPLLEKQRDGHYDVSGVTNFGCDPKCTYPYKTISIKTEPFDGMVIIQEEVKKEFCSEEYVYWDSTDSEEEVDSLVTLSLKTIFSQKLLGRMPRKRRVKLEEDKTIDVSSDGVSDESFKGFNVDFEVNNVSRVEDAVDSGKCIVNNFDRRLKTDLNVSDDADTETLDSEKSGEGKDGRDGDFNNEIEDFGTSTLNGNDTNDSFEDIDGSKLIAALNAQIGEYDVGEERSFNLDKHEVSDHRNDKHEMSVSREKINDNEMEHLDDEIDDGADKEKLKDEMEHSNDKSKEIDKDSEVNSTKDKNEMEDYFNVTQDEHKKIDHSDINVNTLQNEVTNGSECVPKEDITENGHKDCQIENGKCDKLSLEDLLEKDLEKNVGLGHISDEDYNFDV